MSNGNFKYGKGGNAGSIIHYAALVGAGTA
jgi:hypothetical protein